MSPGLRGNFEKLPVSHEFSVVTERPAYLALSNPVWPRWLSRKVPMAPSPRPAGLLRNHNASTISRSTGGCVRSSLETVAQPSHGWPRLTIPSRGSEQNAPFLFRGVEQWPLSSTIVWASPRMEDELTSGSAVTAWLPTTKRLMKRMSHRAQFAESAHQ